MSSTVFYKQTYRSRNLQNTPGLNARHLHYIATRPGAVYNPGCGFGLWGKLPWDDAVRIQTDLERTERLVKERSEERTFYRGVLSVKGETAQMKGLYRREVWEELVNEHIGVIAKEMDIRPESFCWCASMHYAKGHPHVHILYWDNSSEPRPESMDPHRFTQKAERIRAAFSGALFREEIRGRQQQQRQQGKELRVLLQAMCREVNPEKAVDLNRLGRTGLPQQLAQQMEELLRRIPSKGSLRYAYLPPDYKALVDKLVDTCLEVPELHQALQEYERCTREISDLYANGERGAEEAWQQAYQKLHRELANEVMRRVLALQKEIRSAQPEGDAAKLMDKIASEILPNTKGLTELQAMMPRQRIPLHCMEQQIPGLTDGLNRLEREILTDARIRMDLERHALHAAGIDLTGKPDAVYNDPRSANKTGKTDEQPVLFGKQVTAQEQQAYREEKRQLHRQMRTRIKLELRAAAGWEREAAQTGATNLVCDMMRLTGQILGQQKGRMSWKRLYSKDKSKAAKRDQVVTQPTGEWDQDFEV